ncbi:glycine zipper domain-containing protein [Aporhodopirellula aestuarii]|uniref:Glycine zipper domain-containing protein n=1 Tax=Aporhodopirellula aestuarii TaxID=2950107 RepID=A0ABT0U3E2_9BACT|nr:glycine zipper domain-containing protein [Aporhodopirellula aestuarii]MCM2371402.1 glycine zipper domain-containing protein [Aporhodopirellula aestuarii]
MTRSPLNSFISDRGRRIGCVMAVFSLAAFGMTTTARAQNNTQRGATLGGITGAIAGAIIGENNDEAGAGAAIGGAIGVVAGGLLGNAKDKDIAYQNQYYRSQPYPTQYGTTTNVYAQPVPTGAVSFSDVIAMSRSGVGESVILNQIATRGVQRRPVVSDIISLHQQGVSEHVISAMQQAPVGAGETIVAQPPTRIVETPVYVTPRPYPVPVYDHHRHHGPVYRARPSYHIHYGH